ncbi:precorrin-3B synthase [Labrys wisconsinensis]|uniref:Precorrin-3B synthase n=1 Tax=Labrys wisconsinensis TaxID=425677 RepID=A0ABU0JDW7_9HYPH|nr:precorrin-3B synthase [Labrys wisconsinensis]MDQ0472461.1 precorrin-3B synthase [Labrys wisconsinensis]
MSARRRGWCPGALRPMRTGDGLLVRVRITAGVVPPGLAQALAGAARAFGNGLLDLSGRANLQLRGVTDETLGLLQARLAALGLLDADAAGETVRNVLASPLAGLDPAEAIDVGPLALALEKALVADPALHALPAKVLFLIDGGGTLPLDGVDADVRFAAMGRDRFSVEAGGAAIGTVAADGLVAAATALAKAFLALRVGEERRFREVVARLGAAAVAVRVPPLPAGRGAGVRACTVPDEAQADIGAGDEGGARLPKSLDPHPCPSPGRERGRGEGPAGYVPFAGGASTGLFAAAAPFGRLTADQLDGLAALAAEHGCGLRLSPWRAILLAPVPAAAAPALAERIAALGLVVDPADPRLAVAACPGSPACASGEGAAQRDAVRFAEALAPLLARGGISVHVSGCPKGCARRAPATLTLVAQGGRYGLAFQADAMAPSATPPMSVPDMAARLAALDPSEIPSGSPKTHARP